ncbi:hypothetical protein KL86APRO_30245 [uncultured Alphaproteobacteria bacterium]|uniref:Uncharacterized protein n=1 Tax=uncultured Alphaproteobacteria bacterium TaxID=91750 RepID=A0A212KM75_9PROT|nr:hypothetical protein KL86APRO_30245 [uncultured Alphaproteobacteria bacterium]
MASREKYPGPILAKLSAMMDELMLIAEQIEANERARSYAQRRNAAAEAAACAGNVVPFRRPSSQQQRESC